MLLTILAGSALVLVLGGWGYSRLVARTLGEDDRRRTPAHEFDDGCDFVPTPTPVVMAHHFASIAGAGPIIGPMLALLYGWLPCLLWVIIGSIFIGAVHDFCATYISMRTGGRSLAVVTRQLVGKSAYILFMLFLVALLGVVCAAFLDLSIQTLTTSMPLATLNLPEGVLDDLPVDDAGTSVVVGGITSTSVILISLCAPLIGWLYIRRRVAVWVCSLLAMGICAVSVWLGSEFPVNVEPTVWGTIITAYVFFSAALPVWLFLQSRDFINVHILYAGMVFLVLALLGAGLNGQSVLFPASNVASASEHGPDGGLWPWLFIIIACGAVSGFHSICAGGTTCKQLQTEKGARIVGYWSMILEAFLAVCVICAVVGTLSLQDYSAAVHPAYARIVFPDALAVVGKSSAILAFATAVGRIGEVGLGLPAWVGAIGSTLLLGGFLLTTLDTAVRLMRYILEEIWQVLLWRYDVFHAMRAACREEQEQAQQSPPIVTRGGLRMLLLVLRHYWFNTALAVGLMLALLHGTGYQAIWKVFGAANQLLAGFGLMIAGIWLLLRGRNSLVALIPGILMLATSLYALVALFGRNWSIPTARPLLVADAVLIGLGVSLAALLLRSWLGLKARKA